jgi:hypothetical protein
VDRAVDSVIDAGLGQQNKMEWNLSDLTEVFDPPSALMGSLGSACTTAAVE